MIKSTLRQFWNFYSSIVFVAMLSQKERSCLIGLPGNWGGHCPGCTNRKKASRQSVYFDIRHYLSCCFRLFLLFDEKTTTKNCFEFS